MIKKSREGEGEGEDEEEEEEEKEGNGKYLPKIDEVTHFSFVGKSQNTIRSCIFEPQTSAQRKDFR